jgi:hypothetical protein
MEADALPGWLAGMELASSGEVAATGRGKKKALRKVRGREKKPSSYRNNRREREREEFIKFLREEVPRETREEDYIDDYRDLWECLFSDRFGSFDDQSECVSNRISRVCSPLLLLANEVKGRCFPARNTSNVK